MRARNYSLWHVLGAATPDPQEAGSHLLVLANHYIEGVNCILDTLFRASSYRVMPHDLVEHYWTDANHPDHTIALVEDHRLRCTYLYVIGTRRKLVFRLWNNLRWCCPGSSSTSSRPRRATTKRIPEACFVSRSP